MDNTTKRTDFRAWIDLVGQKVQEALKQDGTVEVGYSAPYAVYVHEDLTKIHPNGQAKFLEQPAREMKEQLRQIIIKAIKDGKTLPEALEEAGKVLLNRSQELVPVQTGTLKESGYVTTDIQD